MAKCNWDKINEKVIFEFGNKKIELKYNREIGEVYGFRFCSESLTDLINTFNKLNHNSSVEKKDERPKQIIVMRKDLKNKDGHKIRTGKLLAQACHASLGSILNQMQNNIIVANAPTQEWLDGLFAKITVYVESEKELLDIYNICIDNNINVFLVKDSGLTEFAEPTYTGLAIGPDYPSRLDPLFRNLPLL